MAYNPNRTVSKSVELEMWLRKAVSVSTDPIVSKRGRGWFPRLIIQALADYVAKRMPEKEGKS